MRFKYSDSDAKHDRVVLMCICCINVMDMLPS